ncbi:MAG: hypothetical protein J5I50_10725 [Chitinophagaceae bacterium]|nr:hypothetical protein [Chitinophagaceae bacterium]
MGKLWYLIYVKENKESRVVSWLNSKKIENFYPVTKTSVKKFFGTKEVDQALLPSRIFVKADEEDLKTITSNNQVINLVYWRNKPVVISDITMGGFKSFTKRYQDIEVQEQKIKENSAFYKNSIRTTIKGSTASLYIPELGYVLISELEKEPEWTYYDPASKPEPEVSVLLFGAESNR